MGVIVMLVNLGRAASLFLGQSVRLQKALKTAQWRPWMRYMLPGLVLLVWLGVPGKAQASCGYYVVIGHPSSQAAAEQARMQERMPWEHSPKPACNGPQCKGQNRPTTPTPG